MAQPLKPLIVLGVTGGIAAYKAADICSALVQSGEEVQVIMTENACRFITPLVFTTLSRRPALVTLWDDPLDWHPKHIEYSQQAKLFVVAPATANFIAKYAHGIADDALTSFAAAYQGNCLIAPAMNPAMWSQQICQENIAILKSRGVEVIGPDSGRVACGASTGAGRLAPVDEIIAAIKENC
jgi:phosphopantothenoylcysteine synthetase/decarboxylase